MLNKIACYLLLVQFICIVMKFYKHHPIFNTCKMSITYLNSRVFNPCCIMCWVLASGYIIVYKWHIFIPTSIVHRKAIIVTLPVNSTWRVTSSKYRSWNKYLLCSHNTESIFELRSTSCAHYNCIECQQLNMSWVKY